ncbi:MAG TPA: response regulator [Chitinophagaceae bacterium]
MPPLKHNIYIVDDDPDDCEAIREAFLQHQQQPEFTLMHDGESLMKTLRSTDHYPSVILLDLNMPGKDGRTALQEIKADNNLRHIPVIVLTTSGSPREKQAAYKIGANCFITKPDTFNQFVQLTGSISRLWLNAS